MFSQEKRTIQYHHKPLREIDLSRYDEPYRSELARILRKQIAMGELTIWRRIRAAVSTVVHSRLFNGFIMAVILVNAITLALQTDADISRNYFDIFNVMEVTYAVLYTLEFILKVVADFKDYFTNAYDLFDFFLLIMLFVDLMLDQVFTVKNTAIRALSILRAFRTLRMLRTVQYSKGLQVLVVALIDTMVKWVIHIVILTLLLMFFFAVMGYYLFGSSEDGATGDFGSISISMLSVFRLLTADAWTGLLDNLYDKGFRSSALIYTVMFVIIGNFILTNIFVGVIIMNISDATEEFADMERQRRLEGTRKKREYMMSRQHSDAQQLALKRKEGGYHAFKDMVRQFQLSLGHDEFVRTSDTSSNLIWMDTFGTSLDHMDSAMYRIQQLQFELAQHLGVMLENKLAGVDRQSGGSSPKPPRNPLPQIIVEEVEEKDASVRSRVSWADKSKQT